MRRALIRPVAAALLTAAGIAGVQLAASSVPAGAVSAQHDRPVSVTPAKWTPEVRDGWVNAMTQVGSTMVLGGRFTGVSQTLTSTTVPRTNLVAFDATTGTLTSFAPSLDGDVYTLMPGPTADTVYAGGVFNKVNGVATKGLVLLSLSTGQIVSGWALPYLNGPVTDLTILSGHLVVGGMFTQVGGGTNPAVRDGMASFDPNTGKLDDYAAVAFAGHHNYNGSGAIGAVGIENFDVTPDHTKMVVIGNFKTADGLARDQIAMLDLTGAHPAVSTTWATTKFSSRCSAGSFDSWVRDVDISPDGSYFAVAATGGPWPGTLCDSVTRWETNAAGSDVSPTWVDATGGDTYFSVAVTGAAVYLGGHERWANNPLGTDSAKAGAVPRPGIAAFDPVSGEPLSWNPARNPRGQGAFALLATPAGLWVGSDTEWIGNFNAHRDRIAFFPISGAPPAVVADPWTLPNNLYLGGPTASGANTLTKYYRYPDRNDYTSAGPSSDTTWPNARGALVAGPWLYYGYSDGLFYRRSFDGTTVGAAQLVDPYNDPLWSTVSTGSGTSVYRGARPDMYGTEMTKVDGMFYDNGKLWYTIDGSSAIYWRAFSPESGIMGAKNTIATAGMPTGVRGMFLAGGKLYYAWGTGVLTRADFGANGPVSGTASTIGGPLVDGIDWRARALFVGPGPLPPANQPPNPSFTVSCTLLACSFDASASTDPDGAITSYAWNFGDGAAATGKTQSHAYAAAGSYPVTLTVTDTRLGTSSTQRTVTVATGNVAPTADFTASCNDLDCRFDSAASADSDGSIADATWDFGDGTTASGRTATHTFSGTGSYTVTLTVTDNQGATSTKQKSVSVTAAPATIDFRAAARVQTTAATATLTIPSDVQSGDGMLLFATYNVLLSGAPTEPAGWTVVARQDAGSMTTVLFQRTAAATDAGSGVTVSSDGTAMKIDVQFAAYSGSAAGAIVQTASATDLTTTANHVTPALTVSGRGSRVVSFWADKSSTTNSWSAPAGAVVRGTSIGTGSGRITSLLTDDGTNAAAGSSAGNETATTDVAGSKATMWTVVLAPAPR